MKNSGIKYLNTDNGCHNKHYPSRGVVPSAFAECIPFRSLHITIIIDHVIETLVKPISRHHDKSLKGTSSRLNNSEFNVLYAVYPLHVSLSIDSA